MTWPDSVQTVTLTVGPLLDASGSPMERVPLTVILGTQVHMTDGGAALPSRVRRLTGADGCAQVTVVATDSTGVDDANFTYVVSCPGITDGPVKVALPAAVPTVAVESLVPAETPDIIWAPGDFADTLLDSLTHIEADPDNPGLYRIVATEPSGEVVIPLATVATTGAYADLTGKPTLGTAAAAATTDFAAASHAHSASDLTSGTVDTARLGSGTASENTFLRGDRTWAAPASRAWVDLTTLNATYGDDFTGASLDAAWTRVNLASGDETYQDGDGSFLRVNLSGGSANKYYTRPLPAGDFDAVLSMRQWSTTFGTMVGLAVLNGSENGFAALAYDNPPLAATISSGVYGSLIGGYSAGHAGTDTFCQGQPVWYRLTRSGTTVSARISLDGVTWSPAFTNVPTSPTKFAIGRFFGAPASHHLLIDRFNLL